jgi:hypothetical protein
MRGLTMFTRFVLASAALAGCGWGEFEDLKDQTWVTVTERPSSQMGEMPSGNFAVAIAPAPSEGASGGRLYVLGASPDQVYTLAFAQDGTSSSQGSVALSLGGVSNPPGGVRLLRDPDSAEAVAIASGSAGGIQVLTLSTGLEQHPIGMSNTADAAVFIHNPSLNISATMMVNLVVASGNKLHPVNFEGDSTMPSTASCEVEVSNTKPQIRALAVATRSATTHDTIVTLNASGTLARYPASVAGLNGCMAPTPATDFVATNLSMTMIEKAEIHMIDDRYAVVVVAANPNMLDGDGHLAIYDLTTNPMMQIGETKAVKNLNTATVLDLDSGRFVVAGASQAIAEGIRGAGVVTIFKFDTTSGLTVTDPLLHNADPDGEQSFGRGVAAMEFNGKQIIAVATSDEVYTYWRLSPLYDDMRP